MSGPGATSDSEYDSGYDPSQASTLSQSHLRRPDRRARPAVESLFVRLVESFRSPLPSVGRLSASHESSSSFVIRSNPELFSGHVDPSTSSADHLTPSSSEGPSDDFDFPVSADVHKHVEQFHVSHF